MADPRLFFEAPDGPEGTQFSVVAVGQGSTRQVSTFITADDVVGLTPGIAPGDYDGQPAAWAEEAGEWQGLTLGSPLVYRRWTSDAQCLVEPTTGFQVNAPEEIGLNAASGAVIMNLTSIGALLQSTTLIRLNANEVGGFVELISHGVDMTLADGFQCVLGEGGDYIAIDLVVGFAVVVEPGLAITHNNGGACVQLQTTDQHNWTVPNAAGNEEIQNVAFSHAGDVPTVGFLGAAPVPKQSITGATTQDQVDSLVAALVALGFVSDDR